MSFSNVYFILFKPQLAENIGACARALKNFNFKKLRIVSPRIGFPNEKVISTSVGAKNIVSSSKIYDNFEDSIKDINKKLIDRHPHIFSDVKDKKWQKGSWELAKKKEKNRDSILDGVPIALPALLRARRIQEKAANVGFDWDNQHQVFEKIDEEIEELKEALACKKGINEELGDVLFTIVNLSRHLKLNPEESLKISTNKFSKRFKNIEKELKVKKINIEDLSLDDLDLIWEKNKTKNG